MAGTAGTGAVQAPPNSFGSAVVNGQLIGVQTTGAYYPKNFGGGISATPAGSPVTVPPNVGYGLAKNAGAVNVPIGASSAAAAGSVPGLNGTSSSTTNRGGHNGPALGSPAMWAIGLMAFGAIWLRYVHWRKPAASRSEA